MRKFWTIRGWGFVVAASAFIFVAHLFFGANTDALSMVFSSIAFVMCGLAFAVTFRTDFSEFLTRHRTFAVLFIFILAAGFLQLMPIGIGDANPLWLGIDGPAVITLDRDATVRALLQLGALGMLFLFGAALASNDRRARFFFSLLLVAITAYSFWAFIAFFLDPGFLYGSQRPYHGDRLAGSFLSANSAATLFGTFSVLAVAELFRAFKNRGTEARPHMTIVEASLRHASLPGLALLFSLTCLALSASRAGIAVSITGLLVFVMWENLSASGRGKLGRDTAAILTILVGGLIAASILSGELALSRYGDAASETSGRMVLFEAHWAAFKAAPWFGYGLGTFPVINQMAQTAENWRHLNFAGATHNIFMERLEEGGVFIAAPMFTLIGLILLRIFRGIRSRRVMATRMRAILVASLILIGHGITDFALEVPSIAMYWALLLGIGAGLAASRSS